MENTPGLSKEDEQMELPPGFRFHPTDEELISQYLFPKVLNNRFCAIAIGEVDLNKCEPWDLPWRAKMGENEWYFFCVRDKKYPTGLRTNRATDAGYWKATGKDKEILKAKTLVGMKKTLVFYKGRAPKGEKTNWVMHEYRLEGKYSVYNLPKTAKNEWVLCRIFQKSSSGKKTHISGLVRLNSFGNELRPSLLPPLMESHSYNNNTTATIGKTCHVTCFSDPIMEDQKTHEAMNMNHSFNKINICPPSNPSSASFSFPDISFSNSFDSNQVTPSFGNLQYPDSVMMPQDQSILRMFWENQEPDMKPNSKAHQLSQVTGLSTDISSVVSNQDMVHRSFEDKEDPSSTAGSVDLDSLGLLRFGSGF